MKRSDLWRRGCGQQLIELVGKVGGGGGLGYVKGSRDVVCCSRCLLIVRGLLGQLIRYCKARYNGCESPCLDTPTIIETCKVVYVLSR